MTTHNNTLYNQKTAEYIAERLVEHYDGNVAQITIDMGFTNTEHTEAFLRDPQSCRMFEISVAANITGLLLDFTLSDDVPVATIYSLVDKYINHVTENDRHIAQQLGLTQDKRSLLTYQQLDNQQRLYVSLIEYRKNTLTIQQVAELMHMEPEDIEYFEKNIRMSDIQMLYKYANALGTSITMYTVQFL